MTIYRLRLDTTPAGAVHLRLGWGWRVFFILVTAIVLLTIVHEGRARGLLPVIGIVSLFAAVYHESWFFEPAKDRITSRIGIFFFARNRRYRFSALRCIRVRTRAQINPDGELRGRGGALGRQPLIPPAVQRGYVQLILEFSGDDEPEEISAAIVQTESIRNRDHVTALGEQLGRALHVPVKTRFG